MPTTSVASTVTLTPNSAAVPAPSLTSNPAALLSNNVTGIVASLAQVLLSPFAAPGGIPAPAEPPTLWALLAWVRRELFNESPTVTYLPGNNVQTSGLVVGDIGATDPDGDALTYTLVGSPLNGGRVQIDHATGTFVYQPTRAMAEVGGTDRFTVVVSDEASGLHVHGPAGLLQFAPVASPVLNVLRSLPVVGGPVSTLVAGLAKLPVIGDIVAPYGKHAAVATIEIAVAPTPGQDLSFGPDFHFGVSTGAFQSEMGSTDTGQPIDPGGMREALDTAASYGLPLWITENGIANSDDSQRSSYIVRHLAVVQDAVADGMDIRGYNYWSLTDVLEWSNGYDDMFGLYSFDPVTLERTPRPSVAVVHAITTANGLSAQLLTDYLAGGSD